MERTTALEQLAIRLSHLADDADDALERLLRDIRTALKGNAEAEQLDELSRRLATAMLASNSASQTGSGAADLSELGRLISAMPIAPQQQKQLVALSKEIATENSEEQRRQALTALLSTAGEALGKTASRAKGAGGVRRWLGKKGNSEQSSEQFEEIFLGLVTRLLDHIEILNGDTLRTNPIRESIHQGSQSGKANDLLQVVVEELEAIDTRIRAERDQTTDFLGGLQERLDGFEEVLTFINEGSDASLERSEALQDQVGQDTQEIGEAAKTEDVDRLREAIGSGMSRITERLAEHVVVERQQHEEAKARVSELNQRLEKLEEEANVLRTEVRDKSDLALKDALTGVYNRAGYETRAAELFTRWKRSGAALSMVFADCNKFKQINDNFGHAAGDLVLVKVAEVLERRSRGSDVVCRYGGDEFVILLPNTPVEGAEVFARAAYKEVLDAGFNDNGRPLDVSISCGITALKEGDTLEQAVSRADEAMYKAKQSDIDNICIIN